MHRHLPEAVLRQSGPPSFTVKDRREAARLARWPRTHSASRLTHTRCNPEASEAPRSPVAARAGTTFGAAARVRGCSHASNRGSERASRHQSRSAGSHAGVSSRCTASTSARRSALRTAWCAGGLPAHTLPSEKAGARAGRPACAAACERSVMVACVYTIRRACRTTPGGECLSA